jgi:hypothetical protein
MAEKLNPKSRGREENFDMEIYRLETLVLRI